ncbi:transglutaminase domain-containing protein [Mycoplasmopsis caviae]|uniref:Transglutaminase domain-containing protein n=1 Tax=Mycoplasmopsis caviae TaxID=55603 RepID=A0A3P8KWW8_9BACT|nr:transglutaminase domain-containing protein [Mycoplasmopsis caviae]UUD35230.1 transglutaminase domain-containing protein [Mycoplasmopsis caviae]VDR41987.1 Uncharacterised protein [Mycoplasmopsis caviae]
MRKTKNIFSLFSLLSATVSLPFFATSCIFPKEKKNEEQEPNEDINKPDIKPTKKPNKNQTGSTEDNKVVAKPQPKPKPQPQPKPVPKVEEIDNRIYKYGLKADSIAEMQLNENKKALSLSKVMNFVGDIDSVEHTRNTQLNALVNKALKLRDELIELNEKIYNAFGLHEGRYKTYLDAYENFVTIGFNQLNTGLTANINGTPYPTIRYILENYEDNPYTIQGNIRFFTNILDNIEKSINYYKKDLDLSFDLKDAYEVDLNNLDFLKTAKAVDTLSKEQVLQIRKDLLFKGKITTQLQLTRHNSSRSQDKLFADFYSTWYDITGGSNYFNDVADTTLSYTNNKILIKPDSIRYRTDSAREEVELNSLMTAVIYKIISKNMTIEQKVRAIHNWVVENNEYLINWELKNSDKEPLRSQCRSPYSYFTAQKRRIVCEGYARTFSRFLTLMNIPVWYIGGPAATTSGQEGHAWNMVRINGKEYYFDPTWNDPSMDASMDKNFQGKRMMPHRFKYYMLTWNQIKNTRDTARDFSNTVKEIASIRNAKGLDYIKVY